MSLAFDEYGRPFIVLREQDHKKRIKGIDAIKVPPIRPRETSLRQGPSPAPCAPHLDLRDLISCVSLPTRKSLSPMTVLRSSKKWRSSTQLLALWSSSPRVRTMKLEMEPQVLWYLQEHCWNKLRNCSRKVPCFSFRPASSQDIRWIRPRS